jgi:sialate O-acetylesterase
MTANSATSLADPTVGDGIPTKADKGRRREAILGTPDKGKRMILRTRFLPRVGMIALFLASVAYAASNVPQKDAPAAPGGLRVHNLFQSNMVVQRGKPVDVWGWSTPGDKITVTFAGKTATATAGKDRSWEATLPALEASSQPATMTIQGQSGKITLDNILIGDVWILGGQSNMAHPISRVENGALEIASANFPRIRTLTVPKIFGPEPKMNFPRADEFSRISGRDTSDGDWRVCSPDTAGGLSAIGYVMARRIHMVTQIPIGVINTSRGGTTVQAWTPMARMRKLDAPEVKEMLARSDENIASYDPKADLQKQIKKYEDRIAKMKKEGKKIPADMKPPTKPNPGPAYSHGPPGNCYASVISPIAGLAVKGVIFHQGYNNCFDGVRGARMYRAVFPEMIRGWRAAFNDPALPFGILSQCTAGHVQQFDTSLTKITDIGARIREAQYQTFLEFYKAGDKNIGFVSTYDLRRSGYHPSLKVPSGERIARWALATQYGLEGTLRWQPPMLKEMKVENGAIVLTFDQQIAPVGDGSPMAGFAIAGKDMRFQPATITYRVVGKDSRGREKQDTTTLVLRSSLVPEPVHYRYAWARNPMGNLQARGNSDIPLPTQRSDDWTNGDLLKALTGKDAETPLVLSRGEKRQLSNALASEDRRRLVEEANALLKQEQEVSAK